MNFFNRKVYQSKDLENYSNWVDQILITNVYSIFIAIYLLFTQRQAIPIIKYFFLSLFRFSHSLYLPSTINHYVPSRKYT